MPVTTSALPDIAFSLNEINLEITSTDHYLSNGVAAETNISFYAAVPDGLEIILKCPAGDFSMVAAIAPDDSGKQFPVGDGSAAYVASLVDVFRARYEINELFTVSFMLVLGYPTLRLTARKPGIIYNIADQNNPPVNVFYQTAGVNEILKPNFSHHLQIWLKRIGAFEQVWKANLQLDFPITGKTTKNIAPLLHPYLVPGFANGFGSDRPPLVGSGWVACSNTILEYFVSYAQFYGTNPAVGKLHSSNPSVINIGGLDLQTSKVKTLKTFISPDAGDQSKTLCLRQGSKVKKIQPMQPEFLFWLNLTGAEKIIKVKFELFFNEGGSTVFYSATQTAAVNKKFQIAVGYNQANVVGYLPVGKTPAYYTAQVVNDGDLSALSVVYSYLMDVYRQWPRYFVYRNALGGFQTLYTWGKAQDQTDITTQDFTSLTTDAQAADTGRRQQTDIRLQSKISVFTGYRNRRDIKLLKDFIASEEKYLVSGNGYVPVLISSDSLKEAPDGDHLNGASFEFKPKYDELVYTDDPAQEDLTNNAVIPVLHPIYFGVADAIPLTEADVLITLSSQIYSNTVSFETGTTKRHFIYAIQADKNVISVTDEDATIGADLTLEFPVRGTISIAGVNYNIRGMITGGPYSPSHTLTFNNS